MKNWTSLLAAGAILAFAAPVGSAAIGSTATAGKKITSVKHVKKSKHAKHTVAKIGYGPYAYLGSTQLFNTSTNGWGATPMISVPAAHMTITAESAYELFSFEPAPSVKNIADAIRK